jgi:hypothetical protein
MTVNATDNKGQQVEVPAEKWYNPQLCLPTIAQMEGNEEDDSGFVMPYPKMVMGVGEFCEIILCETENKQYYVEIEAHGECPKDFQYKYISYLRTSGTENSITISVKYPETEEAFFGEFETGTWDNKTYAIVVIRDGDGSINDVSLLDVTSL